MRVCNWLKKLAQSLTDWRCSCGMLLGPQGSISLGSAAGNLLAATAGNIVGGTLLVAGVYWLAYLRHGHG